MFQIEALEKLAAIIRHDNAEKGFDAPSPKNLGTKLMLVISEICEAQNELRDGHGVTEIYYSGEYKQKPEGFPVEIADAIIRILDIQYSMSMPINLFMNADVDITRLDDELLHITHCITLGGMEPTMNLALTKLFQISRALGLDMPDIIDRKLAYNRSRPHKHGRTF